MTAVRETAFRFQVQPEFHPVPLGIGEDEDTLHERLRRFSHDYWGEREDLEPLRRLTTAAYSAIATSRFPSVIAAHMAQPTCFKLALQASRASAVATRTHTPRTAA